MELLEFFELGRFCLCRLMSEVDARVHVLNSRRIANVAMNTYSS